MSDGGNLMEARIDTLPKCTFCTNLARYDGKTLMGPWAYMCEEHFTQRGIGLGLGRGQRLITPQEEQDEDKEE
jgi:hypothetical protein